METSDSEYFESADEEFVSDNEDEFIKTTEYQKRKAVETVKLNKLNITEKDPASTQKELQHTKQINKNNSSSDAENDSNATGSSVLVKGTVKKPERKSKSQRTTLGVKLGTKINKADFGLQCSQKETNNIKFDCDSQHVEDNVKGISNKDHAYQIGSEDKSKVIIEAKKECFKNAAFGTHDIGSSKQNKTENMETNVWDSDNWELMFSSKAMKTAQNKNANETATGESHKRNDDYFSTNWSGWGNWGVTSLLSTATMGVTTITNHVSQGITTVLESGIGLPDPEELARLHKADENSKEPLSTEDKSINVNTSDITFGLGSLVSGVTQITKLVETTGNKVISSGLDTLETIGKKTMEVLQEGDPGLKKKRAFLNIETDKPVLSQILREAKEKAEHENKMLEEKHFSKKANYETLFDDHQGLVHLEALEMLSKQCDIKLQTLLYSQSGDDLIEMQETLGQIKELCELTEDEDEELGISEIKEKLDTATSEMNIPISYSKLISTWEEAELWLKNLNLNVCNEMELHEQSINILAQLTAIAVELFHKTGELLLIKEHRSTVDEADSLVQLTISMTTLISSVAKKVTNKLDEKASKSGNNDKINGFITDVYYEASNSSSYIKNAFQLLIPVLQVGAV